MIGLGQALLGGAVYRSPFGPCASGIQRSLSVQRARGSGGRYEPVRALGAPVLRRSALGIAGGGGGVEPGHTIVEALKQECREENGVDVEIGPLTGWYDPPRIRVAGRHLPLWVTGSRSDCPLG
ncbi:NUDIX domain-containing protein [Nocardioides bruguierae]|uniref:NUDIX domain-containing protein n=1 Tax=Nocardioides bruguierae TaxID=2945102 RepID=UPI003555EA58